MRRPPVWCWSVANVTSSTSTGWPHDKSDQLVYNKTTGDLYYDKDGKGGAAAILFVTIANHPGSLDHGDFLII